MWLNNCVNYLALHISELHFTWMRVLNEMEHWIFFRSLMCQAMESCEENNNKWQKQWSVGWNRPQLLISLNVHLVKGKWKNVTLDKIICKKNWNILLPFFSFFKMLFWMPVSPSGHHFKCPHRIYQSKFAAKLLSKWKMHFCSQHQLHIQIH